MNIYSWNVNGIRSAIKKGFETWFKEIEPDILCLQEVRAELDQVPTSLQNKENYFTYWNPSKTKKGYSGVAIYSKIEPDLVNYGMGIEEFDQEGRMIQLVFPDWVLNNVYFPNGGQGEHRVDYKLRFYDAFLENSLHWLANGKHVVTVGDYNTAHQEIDLARPKDNETVSGFLPIERAWLDKYIENGFIDTYRHLNPEQKDVYTWWSNRANSRARNVGWRIDYAFVDKALMPSVLDSKVHPEMLGSDHCPISLELDPPFSPMEMR
ncbi:MAG: exodeoxyribonuclease III [Fibrobacter sp.]|jgi:exodeoxyribonuclease-3|nr:exodeoxyribonuclease III [Fibrobacter sp.]